MVFASLPPWRSILLFLLSITILHVMSIPLPHGNNGVAKVEVATRPISLVRVREEDDSAKKLYNPVKDEFTDEWRIYIGDSHGFVARMHCDNDYKSPTWPWKASAAGRFRAKEPLHEKLAYYVLPITLEEVQRLDDELLAIPPRGRY
ncbi:hypothetical protein J3R30DRAFT_3738249 [Lentinula aciculospora]|uniref:Uncharacterized protein n=1 Tax=Lentinula aciculospora TaxID=153920 RepID=A0A9W8ZYT8_9AGAR|nr:hypothetical protein J3R30DRAFT_3738249 [Lentinula aciculospora]